MTILSQLSLLFILPVFAATEPIEMALFPDQIIAISIESKGSTNAYVDPDTEEIKGLIQYFADIYKVNDKLAYDLAEIESQFNHLARNANSTAKGLYQFIDSTWEDICVDEYEFEDVLNAAENIECTMKILSKPGGISHWCADINTRDKLRFLGYRC